MAKSIVITVSLRGIVLSVLFVVGLAAVLGAGLWAYSQFSSTSSFTGQRPELKATAPLQPVTRSSVVIAPVAIAIVAIRDIIEANAPRDANGTSQNPYGDQLGKSEITWSAARGPIQMVGASPSIDISTVVNGSAQMSGQSTNSKDNIVNRLGGMLGGRASGLTRMLDQKADLRGAITISARPALLPNWRFDPNLTGEATMGEVNFAGFKLNASDQIKPTLDKAVNEQMSALSNRLRNDPMLELAVRPEWAKLCRSIPLGQPVRGTPPLWLEVRPTKAVAGQPRILPDWVILTVGVQAETRIVSTETRPDCPFPARLEIVPQLDKGQIAVAVPIDVPITELNRVLEDQLKGKTFPDDPKSPGEVTVLGVNLAASGDRLLVSMRVKARETKSWFGFGGEANVYLWGKPVLDQDNQIMRLSDVTIDVESEGAFGLLGAAARAAMPYVQSALVKNAVIDLKPFLSSARTSIDTILADFKRPTDGVEVEASITGVRLASVAFDAKTMRVIGEAQGTARALVRKIPLQ